MDLYEDLKDKVGGKAAALLHMAMHGIPVPAFTIVTPEDYKGGNPALALKKSHGCAVFAVRSSAPGEDSETASFAGMNETKLNVPLHAVSAAVEEVMEVPERAKEYAKTKGISIPDKIPVVVQCMVNAQYAGVAFTRDPVTGRKNFVVEAVAGLGEKLVSGRETPSRYVLSVDGKVISRHVNTVELPEEKLRELAKYLAEIENIFGVPVDVEWAVDREGFLWILQARPITATGAGDVPPFIEHGEVLIIGVPASPGAATGVARVILDPRGPEASLFREGDILVVKYTDPEYMPLIKKAAAIVADEGGMLSHTAIVARELGKPAVVGTREATKRIMNGTRIVVDGWRGVVALLPE